MKINPAPVVFYVAILFLSPIIIYWPGINGPFLFDDIVNIVSNDFLRITDLSPDSLSRAAFSSESGGLKRPIPMLSFALNYYFADGFKSTFPYKITNVLIHSINSILVFWLTLLVFNRLAVLGGKFSSIGKERLAFLSFITALFWGLHPIQLTSVLYVVQRMTSMSALFVLLSLIVYIKSRTILIEDPGSLRKIPGFLAVFILGVLGLYSKENAAMIPVYIVLIEWVLFSQEKPLKFWAALEKRKRTVIILFTGIALLVTVVFLANHYSFGYRARNFSLAERLLTEPRILLFYLSLIFLPAIDAFGIFHDDIQISTSLFTPWTTLPAIGLLLFFILLAFFSINRHRLVTFGILWFFASHLIESTFLPLEIAHEHRNYLALLGPALLIVYFSYLGFVYIGNKKIWVVPGLFLVLLAVNTSLRAWNWSDLASLADFEARNHPNSARAQASLGSMLADEGKLDEAKRAFRRAASLRPYEAADLINVLIIMSWQKQQPSEQLLQVTLSRVKTGLTTALTNQVIEYAVACASTKCTQMQRELLIWLPVYIDREKRSPGKSAFFRLMYAKVLLSSNRKREAIDNLQRAIGSYPGYLPPYFLLTSIYIQSGDLAKAEETLGVLARINRKSDHPRDNEIRILQNNIRSLR